jgi:two-component system OmpR family response regulator
VTTTAPRVLVVDDEAALRELMTMVCAYEGWDVVAVEAGEPAIAAALARRPDVVLLDRMLPDMDGLEVLRRMHGEIPGLPVVLVTALDSAEDRATARAAGAVAYLPKPFGLLDLTDSVRRALEAARDTPVC